MAADDWTEEEQQSLEDALVQFITVIDQREKWKSIAGHVGTRSAKACAERFRDCREKAIREREEDEFQDCDEDEDEEDEDDNGEQEDEDEEGEEAEDEEEEEHEKEIVDDVEDGKEADEAEEAQKAGPSKGEQDERNGRSRQPAQEEVGKGGAKQNGKRVWSSKAPRDDSGEQWKETNSWWDSGGRGRGGGRRGQSSWWDNGGWSAGAGWSQSEGWSRDQELQEGGDAAGDSQWNQGEADDGASREVDKELEACQDENEQRQLLMRREVQKNRERMELKEQRRQQDEAAKAAKAQKLQDEKDQKVRDYREAQDKKVAASMEAVERQRLQEIERQRKIEEETKWAVGRATASSGGNTKRPIQLPPQAQARGWASKIATKQGQHRREQKQAEMERQAAEVLANIASTTTKKSSPAEAAPSHEDKMEKVEVAAVEYPSRARPKRKPIGPSKDAAEPEEAPEQEAPAPAPEPPAKDRGKKGAPTGSSSSSKPADADPPTAAAKGGSTPKRKKKAMWWHKVDGECPISLSPICELPEPPFGLEPCGSAQPHYFDARFLANFLASSCDFIDPVNRRPLTRDECAALDEHLQWYYPDEQFIVVADAFDLFERNVGSEAGTSVQREATSVLQHLFRFSSSRRTDARGRAVLHRDAGLTVVDDDDVLAPDASAPPRPARARPGDDAEPAGDAFPSLPGGAPAPKAKSKAYPSASRGPPPGGEAFPGLPGGGPSPKAWGPGVRGGAAAAGGGGRASSGRGRGTAKAKAKTGRTFIS